MTVELGCTGYIYVYIYIVYNVITYNSNDCMYIYIVYNVITYDSNDCMYTYICIYIYTYAHILYMHIIRYGMWGPATKAPS